MKLIIAGWALALALAWGGSFERAAASPAPEKPEATKSQSMEKAPERSPARVASDVTITSKVKSTLIGDKYVKARDINVDTVNGVVHLRGKVANPREAQRAVALTKKIDGVKKVMNHLQVAPNEKVAGHQSKTK